MILPNELRIGNWVNTPNGYKTVNALGSGKLMAVEYGSCGYADLHSIPLTSEILRANAFVTMDAEIDYVEWGLDNNEADPNAEAFHIIQDSLYPNEPFWFEYDLGFGEKRIEIKYLHQLQNLYFALTGQELEIKLTQPLRTA